MQIKIVTENDIDVDDFIYNYIPKLIMKEFTKKVDWRRIRLYDSTFNINSFDILKYALEHLLITKTNDNTYFIKLDKTLKYNGYMLMDYITLITYGTMEIKGYSILIDIFKNITDNMSSIYNR